MILIRVSGDKVSKTGEFVDIIQRALNDEGKRSIVARTDGITARGVGNFDCVVVERPLSAAVSDPTKFDFLVGLTEAAAYELAQEHGFVVRIWTRNGIPMKKADSIASDRVNLAISHNIVTGWFVG